MMFDEKSQKNLQDWANKLKRQGADVLAQAVKEAALEALELAIYNVSGHEVRWSGGAFRVNVQTGNLRRHMRLEYPHQGNPHMALVFNNAAYAKDIEDGLSGAARKRRLLEGGKEAKVSKAGRKYKTIPGGRGSLIPFWTIHEDSQLADMPARPFMQATYEQMAPRAQQIIAAAVAAEFGP